MSVIYLEDILKQCSNKYLAVNIAAQRARHLNEKGLPMIMNNPRKPVSIAIDELCEGKLGYKELDPKVDRLEEFPFAPIHDEITDEDPEVLEEFQPTQEYCDDSEVVDPDEPEEGL